jgi:hypothetical protein
MENTNNNMEQKPKTSPKDFFLYLGVIVSLYISTISILALWFKIIDEFFTDPLKYSDPYSGGISMAIASLFIIFPIFIAISWVLHKDETAHSEKRELGIRKWLIYLTLFIAGVVIVVDLITLINTFLSGHEITASFISKAFVVLVVIGTIFTYYVQKVRSVSGISSTLAKKLTWGTALFVIISIIIGFVVMGSPAQQRMKRLDGERVSNLQNIQWQIINYWQTKSVLPDSLSKLEDSISGYVAPTDPDTDEPYTYRVKGELAFELCAAFNLSSDKSKVDNNRYPIKSIYGETWEHKAGEVCFERTIDPEKYKLRVPSPVPVF